MSRALLACALAAVCSAAWAEWSFTREVYSCYTSGMTFQELADAGVTYISHVPATAETAAEAHRWGLRIMPYVSLYKVVDSSESPGFRTQPFWREIDLVEHPDWVLIREDGERRLPFDDPDYPAGIYQSCCNQPGIAEAYVRGVENVLATGADGVFVDNVHPYPKCYGPELGIHRHLFPDLDNTEMYRRALMDVYRAVKAHGARFAVMLNSGGPRHEYVGYGDTLMWESFVFRWPTEEMRRDPARMCRTHDWAAVLRAYEQWRDFTDAGGSIAPLTYLPAPELEHEHAFLAWACAKLCGFQQWTGTAEERQDILRQLYRTDTGMPVGPLESDGPVYFRRYERAVVAGNSAAETVRAELPWELNDPRVADLYSGQLLVARDGRIRVELPPDSGRVYVTQAAYLANCLAEAASMARSCSLRAGQLAAEGGAQASGAAAARRVFDDALAQAEGCLQRAQRDGVPRDQTARERIAALTNALAPLAALAAADSGSTAEERLLAGGVTAAELPDLLRSEDEQPFEVELTENGVVLRSGGAQFSFESAGPRGEASLRLGRANMQLWTTKNALADGDGWYHARRLSEVELVEDGPERKRVAFTLKLFGSESRRDVDELDVRVHATIERGVPGVRMETALRNHTDETLDAYWFWNISGGWHSFPDGTTVREPSDREPPGATGWEYLHASEGGGGGVVLAGFSNMGYSGSQLHLFAQPKTQALEPDAEMPMDFVAYDVSAASSWQHDGFLQRRRRWYEQYASLAAQVVAGVSLDMDAPARMVAGVPAQVTLRLSGPRLRAVAGAQFGLSATVGGRALPVTPVEAEASRVRFVVEVPAELDGDSRLELEATAALDGAGGPMTLRAFATLGVGAPVEVQGLRQVPTSDGGLSFAATLRNNLPGALPVRLTLTGERIASAEVGTVLPGGGDNAVALNVPAAVAPASADRVTLTLEVDFEVAGEARSVVRAQEIALLPQAVCSFTARAPVIDGRLDDACWAGATELTGFVHHQTGEPARDRTVCRVLADEANLYVGFECFDDDLTHLRADALPDERGLNPDVPADDSVEIYVDPRTGGAGYFRLALNSLGAAKSSADGGWEVATKVADDRWALEVRIPFAIVGATPAVGNVWGFNACRNDQSSGESAAWSCTLGPYANPDRFGGLLFLR